MNRIPLDLKITPSGHTDHREQSTDGDPFSLSIPDFLDSDSSDHSPDEQPFNLPLSHFNDQDVPHSSQEKAPLTLALPDFSDDSPPPSPPHPTSLSVDLPELASNQPSERSIRLEQAELQLPPLEESKRPIAPPSLEQPPILLPRLTPMIPPDRGYTPIQTEIVIPPLNEPSRPSSSSQLAAHTFTLPELTPNAPPKRKYTPKESSIALPILTKPKRPPSLSQPLVSESTPELDLISIEVDHPLIRDENQKQNRLGIAFDELVYHPTVSRLEELLKTKSYDEITQEAWRSGAMGEVHLLKTSSLVKQQYAKQLMQRICGEAPSLLPQSSTFRTLLTNDQEQLNLLAKVCQELVKVHEWKKIQPILKQTLTAKRHSPKIDNENSTSTNKRDNPNNKQEKSMLEHLIEQCQKLSQFEISEQRGLLQLKRKIYCFLVDILRQEEEALQQYQAEQKNLTPLREGLALLASHIQTSSEALRMGFIREATDLDFSPWEDREPVIHSAIRLDPEDVPGNPNLNDCLQAIRSGQAKRYQLQNFTSLVLRMEEGNEEARAKKVQYLLELSNAYFKLGTPAAFKQAICWIELGITILEEHVADNHPLLLSCYERRGVVRLKMAGKVEAIAVYDNTVPRKHLDASYRDFHHSLPLPKNCDANFVRKAHDVRECIEFDYAQAELSKTCQVDENYAEARYLNFLKEYERLKLDTPQTLNPQFESLSKSRSPSEILNDFRMLLISLTSDLDGVQFKITSADQVFYIQFTSEGLAIDQPGIEAAAAILTRGIQKVRTIKHHQTKIYYAKPISGQQFYKLVHAHADNQQRLKEIEGAIQSFEEFELSAFYKTSILNSPEPLTMRSIQSHLDNKLPLHLLNLNIQAMNHHIINGKRGQVLPLRKSKKPLATKRTAFTQRTEVRRAPQQRRDHYHGSLSGENLHFKKIAIAGDGNCGFSSLAVTREQVRDALIECAGNPEIRRRLQEEVLEAFITEWLIPTQAFTTLYNTWNQHKTSLDSRFRNIRDTIPELPLYVEESIPQSVVWLNEHQHPLEGQQLFEAKQIESQSYQALLDYCSRREVYENYCGNYIREQWLGLESMCVFTEQQQQFELNIWQKGSEANELQIKKRTTTHQEGQQRQVKNVLFSMGNHFDRLLPIDPPPQASTSGEPALEIPEFVLQSPAAAEEPPPATIPPSKEENVETKDHRSESYASALVYACRAITSCDKLLSITNDPDIEKKRFNLLIKRAFIYKELKLFHSHLQDLEEVLDLARKNSTHYLNPSIHFALYQAYLQQNRVQEAEEQTHIIEAARGSKKGKKILRHIEMKKDKNPQASQSEDDPLNSIHDFFQREELKSILSFIPESAKKTREAQKVSSTVTKKKEEAETIPTTAEEAAEIIADFQDNNIQQECLQILRNNQRANSLLHPHRKIPVWESLTQQLGRTTTIKDFCEVILSSILIKGNIEPENLLRIAKLSNLYLKDLSFLDQLKSYVQDAIAAYREEEKRAEDKIIEQLEKAKQRVQEERQFLKFKNTLRREIKDGELLRPGSRKRQQITSLSAQLEMGGEGLDVNALLTTILGNKTPKRFDFTGIDTKIREEMFKELSEILENSLDLEINPLKIENHVLHIRGNNIFMSQVLDQIRNACARDKTIRDVHIIGVHVYLDKSIVLKGMNVAVGGEYLQFMKEDRTDAKIAIDLSGKDGADGKQTHQGEAAGGTAHGQDGSEGRRGDDGKGGQPGGDFCLKVKDPIVGFTSEIIQEINQTGGKGGKGSDGQKGGKGADGKQGEDGRQDVWGGDLADTIWHGYIDHRPGGKATPAGAGGRGGDGGIGGKGGKAGRFLVEGIDRSAVTIKEKDGDDGENGSCGEGGKSGEAKRDGFECVHVKGGFTDTRQTIIGIQPYRNFKTGDRKKDGWSFRFTVEESIRNNQRQTKGKGKSADQQLNEGKKRDAEDKNDLKRDLFNANHAVHLHTQSAEQKANAFDEVTNRLSQAQETEEIVKEQLAAKQHKLGYIDTLIQSTAAILHQAQTEQQVTTQHSRIAALNSGENKTDASDEVADILNNPLKDQESLLPLWDYSPVVREPGKLTVRAIDIAIHHVNGSKGQNIRAIADLIDKIGELPKRKYQKDPIKLAVLIDKLSILIRQLPPHLAMDGWFQVKTAIRRIRDATTLAQAIEEKDQEVSAFTEIVQREEQYLNEIFKKESHQLIMEKGMLRLLQKNIDHYIYLMNRAASKEERSKRKSWFQGQLYQKVYNHLHFINKDKWDSKKRYKPTQDEINWCLNFINQQLKGIKTQIAEKLNFKKTLSDACKGRDGLLKDLHTRYNWIFERIPQMAVHQCYPSSMDEDGRIETLYLECSKVWSTLPSIGIKGDAASSSSLTTSTQEDSPPPTRYEEWINTIKKEGWTQTKLIQLETHVKQIIELQPIVGNVTPYLELLQSIYSEEQQDGLPEVLIELIRSSETGRTNEQIYRRCERELLDLKTNDTAEIHHLRQVYLKLLTAPGNHHAELSRVVDCYLQTRHVILSKKGCLNRLKEIQPLMLEDEESLLILTQLLLKANDLFSYRDFLPNTDFISIASDIFDRYASQAVPQPNEPPSLSQTSSSSSSPEPSTLDHLHQQVLKDSLYAHLGPLNFKDIKGLIDQLKVALDSREVNKISGFLFLLLNLNLSYAQLTSLTYLLDNKGYEKLPNVKEALPHFIQKMVVEKVKFEQKWQAILERAKIHDHIRRQLDENDRLSIEGMLLQISQEANLLPSEETAEVLEEMAAITSRSGCFMIPLELKEIQHRLITRMGCFTNTESNPERLTNYNRDLKEAFRKKDETTDSHRVEITATTSSEAGSSSDTTSVSSFHSFPTPKPLADLATSFMKIIGSRMQKDYLQPCLVAIHHLPLTPNDLIALYCSIERLLDRKLSQRSCKLKKQCLDDIRNTLIDKLKNTFAEVYESRESIVAEIEKKQQHVLTEVGDTLKQSNVLHAERHLAKLDLWFKQINYHYEFTHPTDPNGERRRRLSQAALENFREKIECSGNTEAALTAFSLWLRQEFTRETGTTLSLNRLEQLINAMQNGSELQKRKAKEQFNRAFWRDLLPYYSDDESNDTVLRRMEGRQLDIDIAKQLKLKFDDQLLRDECYQVRKELEGKRDEMSQQLADWIASLENRLSSDTLSGKKLARAFPRERLLKRVTLGSSPIPRIGGASGLSAEEAITQIGEQSSAAHRIPLIRETLPTIKEYLRDLDKRLTPGNVAERDVKLLNTLKNLFREIPQSELPEGDDIRRAIDTLELNLIDFDDFKNKVKKEAAANFIDMLNQVNNCGFSSSGSSTSPFSVQNEKDLKQLKESLASCSTLLGEELFFVILERLTQAIQSHGEAIDLKMLSHLFWVVPRLKDPTVVFEAIETRLPNKWASTLLQNHCLEEFSVPLSQMMETFSPVEMNEKTSKQKDEFVADLVKEKKKDCETYAKKFTAVLTKLSATKKLTLRQKEDLLQFLAVRLSFINHHEHGFTLNHFVDLLDKYLKDSRTLSKLAKEFYKTSSLNRELLLQPSLQSFKYGLTLTWIEGTLENPLKQLNEQEQQRLFDGLFQIETSKKEETMREVVNSLKGTAEGSFMSPAVVECVINFAQGTWVLDSTTLKYLAERTPTNGWYHEIEKYTKTMRSKKRDLKTLIGIMAEEGKGINRSIQHLLTSENGAPSQLERDITDIKTLIDNTISDFDEGLPKQSSKEEIKAHRSKAVKRWARAFKGERCLDTPEGLKKAIAVVSIATEITENHFLRDTQLIALWLTLRPGEGRDHGRIGQVSTGEGKSFIFAGLSVLRALTGSYVDVITTSYVLATKDSGEEKKPFFKLFDLTISNNCDREAEADENKRKERYHGKKGPVNIVYGEVGSFERDILLTEFHGKNIIHEDRLKGNRTVLVDEVDGLFLDSAGMVLYLSHNVDSLKFLRRIFIQIFSIVNQSSLAQARPWDDHAVEQIAAMIKQKLTSGEITIPQYAVPQAVYMEMQEIIDRKLSIWVRSALHAKMLNVNNEYIITDVVTGNKKKQSITVMDKGTGVEQYSLKWSDGLYLFLQLKHGLELSDDSLKAVFLSNYHFFKRYGQHIYGLSGTLGSNTEQKYLEDLYNVDLCKIPRFNGEKFVKYKANVMGTYDEWLTAIRQSVHRQTKELKRAVLVICNSIDEVEIIKNELKKDCPFLLSFERSHQAFEEATFISNEKKKPMDCGDVVVATNLAGRGTDIKTTKLLEDRGGLHVIMSFLPDNIRIEEQGFGRTGRSGNEGSGEFIIIDSKRRPITELCRERDWFEQQRLEAVAKKELKKIEFEHELLRGFTHRGKTGETIKVIGFQKILEETREALQGEDPCYREAQLDSLKNRWAFWIDHMAEKINLVDIIGKEAVIAAFNAFHRGVKADFNAGGFRLIKEPIELVKLGGEFRRQENWSRAIECYEEAAKDSHYAYASYYKAACQLVLSPASDHATKHQFIADAQAATLAIKTEINHLQSGIQSIIPLVEQRQKLMGDPDYGNPFKTRSEEMIQIWSIFQSAIDSAIGGSLTEAAFKSTSYVDEKEARRLLKELKRSKRYQDSQLVDEISTVGDKLSCKEKSLRIPEMFKAALAHWEGRKINRKLLIKKCEQLVTHDKMKRDLEALGCRSQPLYQLSRLPLSFDWEAHGSYSEHEKFILWNIVLECETLTFKSKEEITNTLTEKIKANKALSKVNIASFCKMVQEDENKLIVEDYEFDLKGILINETPTEFKSAQDLKERYTEACTEAFNALPQHFREVIIKAAAIKNAKEGDETGLQSTWSLRTSIRLGHLPLAKDAADAADIIWATLEEQDLIEAPKVKLRFGGVKDQLESIKGNVKDFFKGHSQAEEAVDAIFGIIDSSVGMIYRLDDKKTTAKFADIVRKYYYDHSKAAPEGLGFFIELGLEVIADLIEKKDPPAWFEVLAVTVMGVIQMVAGAIIKAYLPVIGELIGNALISSGMDDVMFAITSAVNGEFSWSDYASHKGESLKRSLISSAISCGVSFGVNSIQHGVDKAWDIQKLSGLEKAALAGNSGINVGSYVLTEMKQTFISTGISQVASRGIEGMTKMIANSYEDTVEEGIQNAVNAHWHVVQEQAQTLYANIRGGKSASDILQECMSTSLKKTQASGFFDGAIRGSKQVLPQASSLVGGGWGTFLSHVPDLAQLGVSIPKLITLVEDNLHGFAREIRAARERLIAQGGEATPPTGQPARDAFNRELESKKDEYKRILKDSFTGILKGAVYAPLVSMGTQKLVELGKDLICPLSEAEKKAQSSEYLLKALAISKDPNQAFLDGPARWWAGANDEVVELTDKQLKEIPENAEASIETLQKQYGSLLKVYKDKDGHLYVQRPARDEYAQAVRGDKASGDPELLALSKITHKNIAVHTPDGKVKTYCQDGTISIGDGSASSSNTIELNLETNPSTGIGHLSLQGASGSAQQQMPPDREMDCLYDAIIASGNNSDMDVKQLREATAQTIEADPDCKRFYHDWSLNNEAKEFSGQNLILNTINGIKNHIANVSSDTLAGEAISFIRAAEPLAQQAFTDYVGNIEPTVGRLINIGAYTAQIIAAVDVTILSGGSASLVTIPTIIHGFDNLQAELRSFYTGTSVDPYIVQFLHQQVHLSHQNAELVNNLAGFAAGIKIGSLATTLPPQPPKFPTMTKADIVKMNSENHHIKANAVLERIQSRAATPPTPKSTDFMVGESGTAIPTTRSVMESGFQNARLRTFPTESAGRGYHLPNGDIVRVMDATNRAGQRASFTNTSGGPINPFTRVPAQPPRGLTGPERTKWVRERHHVDLK